MTATARTPSTDTRSVTTADQSARAARRSRRSGGPDRSAGRSPAKTNQHCRTTQNN